MTDVGTVTTSISANVPYVALQDDGCSCGLFLLMGADNFLANLPLHGIPADVLDGVRWLAVIAAYILMSKSACLSCVVCSDGCFGRTLHGMGFVVLAATTPGRVCLVHRGLHTPAICYCTGKHQVQRRRSEATSQTIRAAAVLSAGAIPLGRTARM